MTCWVDYWIDGTVKSMLFWHFLPAYVTDYITKDPKFSFFSASNQH